MIYQIGNRKEEFTTILEDKNNATTFRHFKGFDYQIITIAKDSETLSDIVVYKALYKDNSYWTRSSKMFFSLIDKEKYKDINVKYRFTKI